MSFRKPSAVLTTNTAAPSARLEQVLFAGLARNAAATNCGDYDDYAFEEDIWVDREADQVFGLPLSDADIAAKAAPSLAEIGMRQQQKQDGGGAVKRILTETTAETVVVVINKNKGAVIAEQNESFRDQLSKEPNEAMRITEITVEAIKSPRGKEQQVAITVKLDKICSMAKAYERQELANPRNSKITRGLVATTRLAACKVLGEKKTIRFLMSWVPEEASVLVNMRKVRGGLLAGATTAVLSFLRMVGVLPLRIPYKDISPDVVRMLQ